MNFVAYAIVWWLILAVIGLIAFPLVSRICSKLPDRGYSISKIVGLLIVTYIAWILPSLHIMKFGFGVVVLALLTLAALSYVLGRKQLKIDRPLLKTMIISEAVFTFAFVLFVIILSRKPDIYYAYSDDYMHYGFLNSILRGGYFPPKDPWYAGQGIEYYYGGHVTVAAVTKIANVPHVAAYEMAMPQTFALTVGAAYGLGCNITKRKLYGALAAIFVIVLGYISGAFELAAYLSQHNIAGFEPAKHVGFVDWMLSFDFTKSNWIIPHSPTFYPYFSMLQGDVTPTTIVIPFQLLIITLSFALLKNRDGNNSMSVQDTVLFTIVFGLSLGFLLLAHTWTFPIYLLFVAFIFLIVAKPLWIAMGTVAISLFLYIPYILNKGTGAAEGIRWVSVSSRTSVADFTLIFGIFLILLAFLLFTFIKNWFHNIIFVLLAMAVFFTIVLVGWEIHFSLLLILLPMILLAVYYIYRAKPEIEKKFILFLLIMGALLALAGDTIYLNDAYGPPYERMNTMMKLYTSIWIFWALAAGIGIYYIMKNLKGVFKTIWVVVLVILIAGSLVHPLLTTVGWSSGRQTAFGPTTGTLDGLSYLEKTEPGDYYAIKWLNKNIKGHPVILEAPGGAQSYASRVSALTGLPTVIGWESWEQIWRGNSNDLGSRARAVKYIYISTEDSEVQALIEKYNIKYIYVGTLEIKLYGDKGLSKFDTNPQDFELVYDQQGVKIYKVLPIPKVALFP